MASSSKDTREMNAAAKEKERNDGKAFEIYAMNYHRTEYGDAVWPGGMIPEEELFSAGVFHDYNSRRMIRNVYFREQKTKKKVTSPYVDDGIDFLIKRTRPGASEGTDAGAEGDGEAPVVTYHAGQAKHYTTKRVVQNDLAGFFRNLRKTGTSGYLYTTTQLNINLREDLMNDPTWFTHKILKFDPEITATSPVFLESAAHLRGYQEDAISAILNRLHAEAGSAQMMLHMGCGLGKTLVAGHLFQRIKDRHLPRLYVCIAPLRVSVANLQDRLMPFFNGGASSSSSPSFTSLVVDSDVGGFTDPVYIGEVFADATKKNKPLVVFATFESFFNLLCVEFGEWLTDGDAFLLVDEMHNLTLAQCEQVNRFHTSLLMSATIPESLKDELDASLVYEYGMAQGIRDGFICDYEVILPLVKRAPVEEAEPEAPPPPDEAPPPTDEAPDDETPGRKPRQKYTYSVDLDIPQSLPLGDVTAKALFLATGMLQTGSRRCIVYLRSKEECVAFEARFRQVCEEYHGMRLWTDTMDHTIDKRRRTEILSAFQADSANHDLFVLMSIRILDEAVDIPRCDSEFITYVGSKTNDIRTVQRLQRGGRLDPRNPTKKNHLFLWADDWSLALNALSLMREEDTQFNKKIRMMSADYDTSQKAGVRNTVKIQTEEMEKYVSVNCVTADEVWNKKCDGLEEYVRTEKKLPPKLITPHGFWFHNQKTNIDKMPAYRRERLMKIPEFLRWYTAEKPELISWEDMCTGLEKYVTDENKLPPGSDKIYGKWLSRQKQGINIMLKTRRERLMKIDLFSNWFTESQKKVKPIKRPWEDVCAGLEEYVKREKKLPSQSDKIYGGWLDSQKSKITKMSEDRRERLLKIPLFNAWFIESQKKGKKDIRKWEDMFVQIEEYTKKENKLPPKSHKIYGQWLHAQKANINSMPANRREQFLKIKEFNEWYIKFNSKEKTVSRPWDDMYAELVEFVKKNNKLPPNIKKNNKDKRLTRWNIHQKEIIDTMPADRRERMMEIPIFKKWYDSRTKPSSSA